MLTLGIDDAGRGPVIGPMVLAGCLMDKKIEPELKKLGVKDSKQLTQKRREFLEKIIKEKSEKFEIVLTSPNEIEEKSKKGINLNELEAIKAAEIINKINKNNIKIKIIIDCPSVSIVKWKDALKTKIKNLNNLDISCEHKADRNHISVSAASILAKSKREKEMDKLKEKYGKEIGSGYTSDPLTRKFLEKKAKKYENKGIFRKTWSTWKKAVKIGKQKKLSDF
ncbi:ribonuclease HII [Candidatus Pacearchaeota archaeon]|jgi:ribonuclease HII|nr:ribonuclease HII [Candidatus Pacearchaeota archaeon]|tara:strand:+ start:182 stop:853 length:672 start_codon:yes stop_codon:yes gene_type:complete